MLNSAVAEMNNAQLIFPNSSSSSIEDMKTDNNKYITTSGVT